MNNYYYGGNNNMASDANGATYRSSGNTTLPIKMMNTYGISLSFLESLGIYGPLVCKVFVANVSLFLLLYILDENIAV